MRLYTALSLAVSLLLLGVEGVSAAASSSFQLYSNVPNYTSGGPHTSDSFAMNEDGTTFIGKPISGSNFQIITAPPTAIEEAPLPIEEEQVQEVTESSGGHRGHRTNEKRTGRYNASVTDPTGEDEKNNANDVVKKSNIDHQSIDPFPGVNFAPKETEDFREVEFDEENQWVARKSLVERQINDVRREQKSLCPELSSAPEQKTSGTIQYITAFILLIAGFVLGIGLNPLILYIRRRYA